MKVITTIDEPLCGRKSVQYEYEKKGTTPSRTSLQKDIAKKEKVDASLVVVTNITNTYGTNIFVVDAQIYTDKHVYKEFVQPFLAKKSIIPEEKSAEASAE